MPDDLQEIEDRVLESIKQAKDRGEDPGQPVWPKPIFPIGAW